MGLLEHEADLELNVVSGVLSAIIRPRPRWFVISAEAIFIILCSIYILRAWEHMELWVRGLFLWGEVAGVAGWFYQLCGSERIEFDSQYFRIRKDLFGWDRVAEYQIATCSSLELHEQSRQDAYRLQCKLGWRTIKFGQYLSEQQAIEILTALQVQLPDVAQKLGASTEGKKHFITMDLSSQ